MAAHEAELLDNGVLASLPMAIRHRLHPDLEAAVLVPGEVLYEPGGQLMHLYFPTSAVVSLIYTMENGATAEMALVGHEGLVGIALYMGGGTTSHHAVVQVAGRALRLRTAVLHEAFRRGDAFQEALLRYAQALVTQISQTAVCNRLHRVEKRLCRWLLLTQDRIRADEILMTQELIAQQLGVRREGVTIAAHRLQAMGLIHYARGHIHILDRARLERAACECYRVVKDECDRLLRCS